jgi:hypothetical protein
LYFLLPSFLQFWFGPYFGSTAAALVYHYLFEISEEEPVSPRVVQITSTAEIKDTEAATLPVVTAEGATAAEWK